MSFSQEEFVLKFGMDLSKFETKLREANRIASANAQKIGSALYVGPQNGSMPQGWSTLGGLSQQSQNLIKTGGAGDGWISRGFNAFGTAVGKVNPMLGETITKLGAIGTKVASFGTLAAPFLAVGSMIKSAMHDAYELAEGAELLGTSSKWALDLSKAAAKEGMSVDEAALRLQRFEALVGSAQAGSKEASEQLNAMGLKPWGKTMEQNYEALIDYFDRIEDPATRARKAVDMFGRGGTNFLHVLEKFNEAKKKGGTFLNQADLDILENGERKFRSMWNTSKGFVGDAIKLFGANALRILDRPGGIIDMSKVREKLPSRLEGPESSPEAQKAALEERVKKEKALTDAKQAYRKAVADSGNDSNKLAYAMESVAELQRKIKGIAGETVEKLQMQTKLVHEQEKVASLKAKMDREALDVAKKRKDYEDKLLGLEKDKAKARQEYNTAVRDRSGWSLEEILSQPLQRNRRGQAIIPQQMIEAMSRFLGRRLGGNELAAMSSNLDRVWSQAQGAKVSGDAAKAFRLLLPGMGMEDWATRSELGWRRGIGALNTGERDPMASHIEKLTGIDKNIADLVLTAKGEGIYIQPRMGR